VVRLILVVFSDRKLEAKTREYVDFE